MNGEQAGGLAISRAAMGQSLSGDTLKKLQESARSDANDLFDRQLSTIEAIKTLREQRDELLNVVIDAYKLNRNGFFAENTLRKVLDKFEVEI